MTSGLTMSVNDLPNLPGIRRDISSSNPQLYKRYIATLPAVEDANNREDDYSLESYFQDQGSTADWASVLSPFPSQANAYNDPSGRYSLKSQQKDRLSRTGALPFTRPETAPAYLCDKLAVCHFQAYFTEKVQGHGSESTRLRKVEIGYYVQDSTIEIIEPRVADSGFLQGKILKRHQVPKPVEIINSGPPSGVSYYQLSDFYSGAVLNIYNTDYTIYDCDKLTRNYFANELGQDFGQRGLVPLMNVGTGCGARPIKLLPPSGATSPARACRGGNTARTIQTAAHAAGFFEYDRKVLRYYCVWDNRSKLYGDVQQVRLHYYLADDTMEILPVNSRNSGRDKLPKYLRKMRVPKGPSGISSSSVCLNASASLTALENVSSPTQYYHWTDLTIGKTFKIASIELMVVDADECTRAFYGSKGYPMGEAIAVENEDERSQASTAMSRGKHVQSMIFDGEATEVMSTVTNATGAPVKSESEVNMGCLLPEAPKKDGAKMNLFQGIVLRFVAQMLDGKPGDDNRSFIVQVFLEDDTLQIREPPMRNSGFNGGVFLKRTRMNVADRCIPFSPSDVYVGAVLQILSHRFVINDADEYTLHYMAQNCNQWIYSSLPRVLQKLKANELPIKKVFLTIPSLASRFLNNKEIQSVMARASVSLNNQEVVTIFRALDPKKTGKIKLTRVLKFVVDNQVEY